MKNIVIDNTMSDLMFFYDQKVQMQHIEATITETERIIKSYGSTRANQLMGQVMPSKLQKSMVAGI